MTGETLQNGRKRKLEGYEQPTAKKSRRSRKKHATTPQKRVRESGAATVNGDGQAVVNGESNTSETQPKGRSSSSRESVTKSEKTRKRHKSRRRLEEDSAPNGVDSTSPSRIAIDAATPTDDAIQRAESGGAKGKKARRRKNQLRSFAERGKRSKEKPSKSAGSENTLENDEDTRKKSSRPEAKTRGSLEDKESRKRRKKARRAQALAEDQKSAEAGSTQMKQTTDPALAATSWTMSKPRAGRYLEVSPRFSDDERHIIMAKENCACIGSVDTSIITGTHDAPGDAFITSFATSSSASGMSTPIYLGLSNGSIHQWSPDGRKAKSFHNGDGKPIGALAMTKVVSDKLGSLLFVVIRTRKHSEIVARATNSDAGKVRVLKIKGSIQSLKPSPSGRVLVAATSESILIGTLIKADAKSRTLSDRLEYSWQEISCKHPPTCFDFRTSEESQREEKHTLAPVDTDYRVDLAYGGLNGCIYMYPNVLKSLAYQNNKQKSGNDMVPRHMHWHREAVGALAFSPDSSYLISGGQETVLVLWQLDTGGKQFLPHLESPIRTLTVSPSGSLYAVGTADNSIMVLSTAELKPVAHFASLQSPSTSSLIDERLLLPTKETLAAYLSGTAATSLPCAVSLSNPSQLLLAAPSYQSANTSVFANTPPSPYLQTYDISKNSHVARQPLARTNATVSNLGPEGNKLREPDIRHLAVTSSGQWLVSVDEWEPPADDLKDLSRDPDDISREIAKQREVTLRFWRWDNKDKNWMLNTSLPSPHEHRSTLQQGVARVLALEVSAAGDSVATLGEDRIVRVWGTLTKLRDDKVVAGNAAVSQRSPSWWALRRSIPLEGKAQDEPLSALAPNAAKMAWSEDGSLIAAWMGFPSEAREQRQLLLNQGNGDDRMLIDGVDASTPSHDSDTIHFIDADAGVVKDSRAQMLGASGAGNNVNIADLAFAGRYLLALSRTTLRIWDLPSFVSLTPVQIPPSTSTTPEPKLAVDLSTNTFAIAIAVSKKEHGYQVQDSRDFPPHAHRDFTSKVQVCKLPAGGSTEHSDSPEIRRELDVALPHLALALVSASGHANSSDIAGGKTDSNASRRGYVVVDSNANIRHLQPPILSERLATAMAQELAEAGAMEIDGSDEALRPTSNGLSLLGQGRVGARQRLDNEGDSLSVRQQPRVVTSQKLAEAIGHGPVLNGERRDEGEASSAPGALPSVRDMFDRVIGMFWGKSRDEE